MLSKGRTIAAILMALMVLGAAATRVAPLLLGTANAQHEVHDDDDGRAQDQETDDAHAHEDGESEEEDGHGLHEEKTPGAHDGYESEALGTVSLSPSEAERAGIRLASAGPGTIERRVRLPGEIRLNDDRAAHIVPRAEGIVTDVLVRVGDRVAKGQVLATLESAELAEAKLRYLTAQNELSCCAIDLTRAEALRESAQELVTLLGTEPTLDDLLTAGLDDMGEAHGRLVSAYAELVFAKASHEREEGLVQESLSSVAEHQAAGNAYKKAYGKYVAARSALSFETERDLFEAQTARQNTELVVRTSRKTLLVLGLTADDVESLSAEPAGEDPEHECDEPDCAECLAEGLHGAGADGDGPEGHSDLLPLNVLPAGAGPGHDCDDPGCADCLAEGPHGAGADGDGPEDHSDLLPLNVLPAGAGPGHDCDDPDCADCLAEGLHGAGADGDGPEDHSGLLLLNVLPAGAGPGDDCDDPNCADCLAEGSHGAGADHRAPVDHFGLYSLRAPFDAVVTQKHITIGEKLSGDADALTVADMSTVWVDLSVNQKDLPYVEEGQMVHIFVGEGVPDVKGTIAYVFPVVDATTRTCTARVIVRNPDRRLRPGLFVSADVHVGLINAEVLVPKGALQRIDDERIVFVPIEGGFEARSVSVGRSSATHVEIEAGLEPGDDYVAEGAFQLKAEMVTSGLGAHAGHGH